MTTDQITAAETLVQAFGALTDAQMARLRRHADRGTVILCGEEAGFYADGAGGG